MPSDAPHWQKMLAFDGKLSNGRPVSHVRMRSPKRSTTSRDSHASLPYGWDKQGHQAILSRPSF